jgi:hypothetical protein
VSIKRYQPDHTLEAAEQAMVDDTGAKLICAVDQ